jgi:hypothetical protein
MKVPVALLQALRFLKSIIKPSYGRFPGPKQVNYNWMVQEQYNCDTDDYYLRFVEGKTGNVLSDTIIMLRSTSRHFGKELSYYTEQLPDGWRRLERPANGRYEVIVSGIVIGFVYKVNGIDRLKWSTE